MKFSCERKVLVECLSNIQRSVSLKSNIMALEGVHISVQDQTVKFESFNMEYGVKTEIIAADTQYGESVIPARILFDISKRLPEGIVNISLNDDEKKNEILINSGDCKFSLPIIDPSDFPKLPSLDSEKPVNLSANILKDLIKQTIFAVSEDDSNPIHTGILIEVKNKIISFVAVDGFRLALRQEKVELENEFKMIVPGKALLEVYKLIFDNNLNVSICISEHYIFFKLGKYEVISRLLEGNFIDYESVIPKETTLKVKLNTRKLIESVERVSLVVNTQLKSPIVAQVDENYIKLSCKTSIGTSNDGFMISATGEAIEIAFNNKYMLEALKNTDGDEILLDFSSSFKPIKIMPLEGDSFLFLILPVKVRTNEE